MAKITDFGGGINTRVDPTKIPEAQAVYLVNADINSGSISTVKGAELFTDSIQYQTNSGFLFFTHYDSATPPQVVQQPNGVIVRRADNTTVPAIPKEVKLDNMNLPSGGPTQNPFNVGHRGTSTNGVGNRDGAFVGRWNIHPNTDFVNGGTPLADTEATYKSGRFSYNFNPDVALGPWINRATSNQEIIVTFGPATQSTHIITRPDGTQEILLTNHQPITIRSDVAGRTGWENDIVFQDPAAAEEAYSKPGMVEIWYGHPKQNWTINPQPTIAAGDSLWITHVSFTDQDEAVFTVPQRINVEPGNVNIQNPNTEIIKQAPTTLSAHGLPPGTTRVNGYLYFTRELLTLLTGEAAVGVSQIRGNILDNGNINYFVVAFTGANELDTVIGQDNPDFSITVPTNLPTTGTGPTSRSPANFVGGPIGFQANAVLRGNDDRVQVSGGTSLASNSMVIYVGGTPENTTIPVSDTAADYNFSVGLTELSRQTNPASFNFRTVGPHPNPPIITGQFYDLDTDTFRAPIGWTLDALVGDNILRENHETWRTIFIINQNGTMTFGTPFKIYDGQRQSLDSARQLAIRMPPTGQPSLDRPLSALVGEDVNNTLTVTNSFHRKDGVWYFGDTDRDYVEYKDTLFYTQDIGVPEFINEKNEVAMGIPRPILPEADDENPIIITGDNLPAAWNPVLRQIDLGASSVNPFPGDYGQQFQAINKPFLGFDQSRIIRTFDTNVGGHEIYNSVIRVLPGDGPTPVAINHLQIILDVFTSDRTLISVGNVNCSNFEFRTYYGSGGGGHGRPTPIAIINRTRYFNMELVGGSYRRPVWRLGRELNGTRSANDSNRTVTFNRLPKPIPPGNTHTIDWEVISEGGGESRVNYRLIAFAPQPGAATLTPVRSYDFSITANANALRFIISDRGTEGWEYKLYRAFQTVYHEVVAFQGTTGTTDNRCLIGTDDLTDVSTAGKATAQDTVATLPTIVSSTTQYAITNVNESLNLESVPAVIDAEATDNANARIVIGNIPPEKDPRVEYRYVYKIDSLYPQWGFIGKMSPSDTSFRDNVNFTQTNLYVYAKRTTEAPPALPEITSFDGTGTRGPGQWDGTRLTPPTGWERERSAFDEAERLYRSRVTLRSSASGGTTTHTASYSIPEEINAEGLVVRVGETLTSARNWEPQPNLQFLTLYSNTLFAAADNVLWFSRYDKPHYWPREHFFEFEDPITGLLSIQQGLLIFTEFKTYILVGSTVQNFQIGLVSAEQGCINHKTAVFVHGTPFWVSDDGIVTYQNGRATVFSRQFIGDRVLDATVWRNVKNAVYWKDVYHVLFGETGDERYDNRILCVDLRYRPIKAYLCDSVIASDDEIPERLGRFDDNQLYLVSRATNGIDFRLRRLMTGSNYATAEYESPAFTDGDPGKLKKYDKIYVTFRGRLNVRIRVDDLYINPDNVMNPMNKKELARVYLLEARNIEGDLVDYEQTQVLRIPQDYSQGYNIRFEIEVLGGESQSVLVSLSYEPWSRLNNPQPDARR